MEKLIEIPWQELQSSTLQNLVEEYVTRDGTDYGETEVPVQMKVEQVIAGIKQKRYVIVFDPEMESAQIITGEQWQQYATLNH